VLYMVEWLESNPNAIQCRHKIVVASMETIFHMMFYFLDPCERVYAWRVMDYPRDGFAPWSKTAKKWTEEEWDGEFYAKYFSER
jgi:hypothetical protein